MLACASLAVSMVPAAAAHPPAIGFTAIGVVHSVFVGDAFVRLTFLPCDGNQQVLREVTYIQAGGTYVDTFHANFEILLPENVGGCVWNHQETAFRMVGTDTYFVAFGATVDGHAAVTGNMAGEIFPFWVGDLALLGI